MERPISEKIKCAVPFCACKISYSKPFDEDQEAICTVHMRPVSKRLKNLHLESVKRAKSLMDKYPDANAPDEIQRHVFRMIAVEKWLWKKIKTKAIEAAAGIA